MPQGDGTGPRGQGPKSNKSSGRCNSRVKNRASQGQDGKVVGGGQGKGAGRGPGKGRGDGQGRGRRA